MSDHRLLPLGLFNPFRRLVVTSLCFSLLFAGLPICFTTTVSGFKPYRNGAIIGGGVKWSDHTHESITRDALVDYITNELSPGKPVSTSSKIAIDAIVQANAGVDIVYFFDAVHHFDDEQIQQSQALLSNQITKIKAALASKSLTSARVSFGQALHTLQDFYSHSNWVENNGPFANPVLGKSVPISGQALPLEPTCGDCIDCINCDTNLLSSSLTTGYFGFLNPFKPSGKCSHGGPGDKSSLSRPTGGINKDTSICNDSPHYLWHDLAGIAAESATKQFVRDLKDQIGAKQLKALLGIAPTLAFAIDTTGSMGSVISGVRQSAIDIVNSRLGTDEEPSLYVLAPFNDPGIGPVVRTDDAAAFISALNGLTASGGGDCPEFAMGGELEALSFMDEGGDLFVATDATAKDSGLYRVVDSLATSKDIRVNHMLFGSCSPIDPAYINVSKDTGGQLFFLQRSEAGSITRLADFLVQPNSVDILSVSDVFSGSRSYTIPVDSTLSKITFSLTDSNSMTVKRPDGSTVQAGDPGVTVIGLSTAAVISIDNPATGSWLVETRSGGTYSLNVSGISQLGIASFDFVKLGGRDGHQGGFPIIGFPVAGDTTIADISLSAPVSFASFDLRSKTAALLQSLALTQGQGRATDEYIGNVTLPSATFLLYVTGTDQNGFAFQRVMSKSLKTQTLKVEAPLIAELRPGVQQDIAVKVTNLGVPETFKLSASDDQGFLRSISNSTVSLATNETKTITASMLAPVGVSVDAVSTLTITAEGTSTRVNNFAIVRASVSTNRPPDISGAIPSQASLWPPNHKMLNISILGVTDPDGDSVDIHIDRVLQDEASNGLGDGDTCPDATGIGTATANLRSERNGTGNGRVYTVYFTATDGKGGASSGSVRVAVPRSVIEIPIDDGPTFISTDCK